MPLKPNFDGEHIYTTLTHPYFRETHIYVATPTRFHPGRGESTDILFMTARGNGPFDRTFREAFIRQAWTRLAGVIARTTRRLTSF